MNTEYMQLVNEAYQYDPTFKHLRKPGINYVPGFALRNDPFVFIVGEAPGPNENDAGVPFVGLSGQLLDECFLAAGFFNRQLFYITNTVKYMPTDNNGKVRRPHVQEVMRSKFYLQHEYYALGKPGVIVTVGAVATQAYGIIDPITKIAGQRHLLQEADLYPMVHPAFVLRNLEMKDKYIKTWEDVLRKILK